MNRNIEKVTANSDREIDVKENWDTTPKRSKANIEGRCGQRNLRILTRSTTADSNGAEREGRGAEHLSDIQVEAANSGPTSRVRTTACARLGTTSPASIQDSVHSGQP